MPSKGLGRGQSLTGRLEKTPEGHVVKSPLLNPYNPRLEADRLRDMRIEAEVFRRLAGCPRVPKLISWDQDTCCLTTQFMEHGNLSHYVQGRYGPSGAEKGDPPVIEESVRRRWAVQAAEALQAVHAVNVIHCDLTPRNFLLDANLDLYLSDFAGSSVDGSQSSVCAGERYQPPAWSWKELPKISDDIFALGSVLLVIMTSREPYADLDEKDVPQCFARKEYPDLSQIACGPVIEACWNGTLTTAGQVLDAINKLYSDNSP
ncbi:Protein kinase-like domain protein [Niveomyces insectorum RCEF 264]|uniref:EKC/KEOPS complex subunit BUD32 n=1 Tax=Niveomyces insectorum RCEF 264 TaxID=1081102 RepID=A0A167SNN3_9HYPO|nr:Protein kinase-like domain protein [Niveomyces insectorum RCEF 264]